MKFMINMLRVNTTMQMYYIKVGYFLTGFKLEENNEWIPAASVKSRTIGRKTKLPKVMRSFSMRVKNFPSFRKPNPNTPKT